MNPRGSHSGGNEGRGDTFHRSTSIPKLAFRPALGTRVAIHGGMSAFEDIRPSVGATGSSLMAC